MFSSSLYTACGTNLRAPRYTRLSCLQATHEGVPERNGGSVRGAGWHAQRHHGCGLVLQHVIARERGRAVPGAACAVCGEGAPELAAAHVAVVLDDLAHVLRGHVLLLRLRVAELALVAISLAIQLRPLARLPGWWVMGGGLVSMGGDVPLHRCPCGSPCPDPRKPCGRRAPRDTLIGAAMHNHRLLWGPAARSGTAGRVRQGRSQPGGPVTNTLPQRVPPTFSCICSSCCSGVSCGGAAGMPGAMPGGGTMPGGSMPGGGMPGNPIGMK